MIQELERKASVNSIQSLRGIAALGVVIFHYSRSLIQYPKLSELLTYGRDGVKLFFLISAFVIVYSLERSSYRPNQFFIFLTKRIIRINTSYYAVILLTFLLFKGFTFLPSFKGSPIAFIPQQFLAHLFLVTPFTKYEFYNVVFWTLTVEFQFYILVGLFYFLYSNKIYKIIFLSVFSLTCLVPLPHEYFLAFNYSPIFALGISLVGLYKSRHWKNFILPSFFLIFVGLQFGVFVFLLLLGSSIAIIFIDQLIKPLNFLGNISYSLYLTHFLSSIIAIGVMNRFKVNFSENILLWFFVKVLVAILIAYYFYILIERPSLRLSKRLSYKKLNQQIQQQISQETKCD